MAFWVVERKQLREVVLRFVVEADDYGGAIDEAAAEYAEGEGREVSNEPAADHVWGAELQG
jgi:hypothetical protein